MKSYSIFLLTIFINYVVIIYQLKHLKKEDYLATFVILQINLFSKNVLYMYIQYM